jgi:hypothetical protein
MPVNVSVNDDRWQFIAGDKYWVLGTLRFSGNYTAGGVNVIFTPPPGNPPNPVPSPGAGYRDPGPGTIKSSRAPWFAVIPSGANGTSYTYLTPSVLNGIDPPNTVGTASRANAVVFTSEPTDINDGKLVIRNAAGAEVSGDMSSYPAITGLFLFQGQI